MCTLTSTAKANTSKNCIICSAQVIISSDETGLSSQLISKGVSQRFCTLVGRYLNFSFSDVPDPPINLKETLRRNVSTAPFSQRIGVQEDKNDFLESHTVCDNCSSIAGSFCDTFQDFSYLQLQLNWRIQQISELMRKAEEIQKLNQLDIKDLSGGIFRREFLIRVQRKSKGFPHVSLDKSDCERKLKSAKIAKVKKKSQVSQSEVGIEIIDIDIKATPSNPEPDEVQVQKVNGKPKPNSSFENAVPKKRPKPYKCGICQGRFTQWTSCKFHQIAIHKTKNAVVIKMGKSHTGSGPVPATTTTSGSRSVGLQKILGVNGHGCGPITTTSVTPTTTTPEREAQPLMESNVVARRPSSQTQTASQNLDRNMNPNSPGRKCRYCPNQFQLFSQLYRHEKSHPEWKPLECRFCGKHFACNDFLVEHEKSHNTQASSNSKENANVPSVNVNANSSQNCSNSEDIDSFISSLINNHDRTAPVTLATSTTTRTNDTMTFSQPINKSQSHKCKFCPRTFLHLYSLKSHERIHTGEKPYKCAICCKKFSQWSNCYAHQKGVHNVAKAMIISELQQSTRSNGFQGQINQTENQHQLIQRVLKPQVPEAPKLYYCKVCGGGFNDLHCLYRHQRNVHGLTQEVIADFRKWKQPTVVNYPHAATAPTATSVPKATPVPKAPPVPTAAPCPKAILVPKATPVLPKAAPIPKAAPVTRAAPVQKPTPVQNPTPITRGTPVPKATPFFKATPALKAIPVPKAIPIPAKIVSQKHNQIANLNRRLPGKPLGAQGELRNLHTPMKSFLCQICGKAFHLKSNLIQHERIHMMNEMAFKCGICHQGFQDLTNCKMHQRTTHKVVNYNIVRNLSISNKQKEPQMIGSRHNDNIGANVDGGLEIIQIVELE